MKKLETELEYMKTYSQWRHMVMCGYDSCGLKDEIDELHRLFKEYQVTHPDFPKDSEVPWWHSQEAVKMWESAKHDPVIEFCWIIHGVDEMYTDCNEKFNEEVLLYSEQYFKDDMVEMIDVFHEMTLHKVEMMLEVCDEGAWMYLSISKKCRHRLTPDKIELLEALCSKYDKIHKKEKTNV